MNPLAAKPPANRSDRILIVDDEPDALELVEFNLRGAGFETDTAMNGQIALVKARQTLPSLILLDVMLPELDGMEVCKLLRRDPETALIPIILLTAKAAEIDRVLGLELGADDYLTKPFNARELILRIRGLLRRRSDRLEVPGERLVAEALVIDLPRHEVSVEGRRIDLTATEFKLLTVLAQRRGRVQSRDQLLRDVWEYDTIIDTRTVDTHMRRLREKLGRAAGHVETVRGVGYRFAELSSRASE